MPVQAGRKQTNMEGRRYTAEMNAAVSIKTGYGVFGTPIMKFTLTFDGSLPSSGNKAKVTAKWAIRSALHPQLADLWKSHPALKMVEENRYFPKYGGATFAQTHHSHPGPVFPARRMNLATREDLLLDLGEPIEKHGAWFRPLVRESYALHCGLKVQFLRKEPPGKVYQGGDIDGRIKTLLDALTMPQHAEQVLQPGVKDQPVYCLLEDDSLVSGLSVESERLLTDNNHPTDYVRLTIEVDVRVRQATIYNHSFLG